MCHLKVFDRHKYHNLKPFFEIFALDLLDSHTPKFALPLPSDTLFFRQAFY